MDIIVKGGLDPIPKIYLVGYGREQIRQFVCQNCGKLFFGDESGKIINVIVCDNCSTKEGTVNVDGDSGRYVEIVGFKQKVDSQKKRSIYNFKKVAKRDNYTCQYCGYSPRMFTDFKPMHVDHIKPFCFGGNNGMNNLVMACSDCNQKLGGKIFRDFQDKKCFIIEWRKKENLPFLGRHWESLVSQ